MKHLLFALLLLPFVGLTYAEAPPKEGALSKPVTVPFELLGSGHMVVEVKLNDKGPYRLIFDTGAPGLLLNRKVAKEVDLLNKASGLPFAFLGGQGDVKVKKLQVGKQQVANIRATVWDHPTVESISRAFGPVEGAVGFPFFARFKMTLDYQAKTMTFIPNGFTPPDTEESLNTFFEKERNDGPIVLSPAAQWGILVRKRDDDKVAGVIVEQVLPGGAAATAGLKAGDRLLTLDGRWTDTLADLYTAAGYVKPGMAVSVIVKRGEKEVELKVKPGHGL